MPTRFRQKTLQGFAPGSKIIDIFRFSRSRRNPGSKSRNNHIHHSSTHSPENLRCRGIFRRDSLVSVKFRCLGRSYRLDSQYHPEWYVSFIWGLYPLNKKDYNPHNKENQVPGVNSLIRFDKLWITMEQKNVTTYQLRERCGIDSKTIRRLRANDNMETKTLNKLCSVLQCNLEDIAEFVPDEI